MRKLIVGIIIGICGFIPNAQSKEITKTVTLYAPGSENVTLLYTEEPLLVDWVKGKIRGTNNPSLAFNICYAPERNSAASNRLFAADQVLGRNNREFSVDRKEVVGWVWLTTTAATDTVDRATITLSLRPAKLTTILPANIAVTLVTNTGERFPTHQEITGPPAGADFTLAVAYTKIVPDTNPTKKWLRKTVTMRTAISFAWSGKNHDVIQDQPITDVEVEYQKRVADLDTPPKGIVHSEWWEPVATNNVFGKEFWPFCGEWLTPTTVLASETNGIIDSSLCFTNAFYSQNITNQ